MPKGDGLSISPEDIEGVARVVVRLGDYAEDLFSRHEFGFPRSILKGHIEQVIDDLRSMRNSGSRVIAFRPTNNPPESLWRGRPATWDHGQSLRFAAGATMLTQRWREQFSRENFRRAFVAKVLFESLAGVLDDVVDSERYSFIEAKDLYHHCFAATLDPGLDIGFFRRELGPLLKHDQLSFRDMIVNVTSAFNELFVESPHGPDLFDEMHRVNQRVVLGQALTMLQKETTLNLPTLRRICSSFSAWDSDLAWHERLAADVSHVTNHSLIDMCFLDESVSSGDLNATLRAWHYYDIVIVKLNNLVGILEDLGRGLCNLALISMRENEVVDRASLRDYNPGLTIPDYEAQLERTAEIGRRGILETSKTLGDPNLFFPFISVMIPVFLMADWIGSRDNFIHSYLRAIAPAIRESAQGRRYAPAVAESPSPVRAA